MQKIFSPLRFINSTELTPTLIKLCVFTLAVICSFFSATASLVTLLVFCLYISIERSYSSVLWLILLVTAQPYTPYIVIEFAMIIFCVFTLIKFLIDGFNKKVTLNNWQAITLLIILAVSLIFLFLPFTPTRDIRGIIQNACFFIIFTILVINFEKINLKSLLTAFAIFVAVICLTFNLFQVFNLVDGVKIPIGEIFRFSLFIKDPNYTGGALLCALASIIILYRTKNLNRFAYFVLLFTISVCIFNTISKAAFIVYVLITGFVFIELLVISIKQKNKSCVYELLIFACIVVLSMAVSFKPILELLKRYISVKEPSTEGTMSTLTTGRTDIWITYLNEIFSSFSIALFGKGSFAPILRFDTHNIVLSVLYQFGTIGSLLLAGIYVIGLLKLKKNLTPARAYLSFTILLMYMSLSALLNTLFYVFFLVFALAVFPPTPAPNVDETNSLAS